MDRVCVSLSVLSLAGFFSFPRAKPAAREERLVETEEGRGVGEVQDLERSTLWASGTFVIVMNSIQMGITYSLTLGNLYLVPWE